MMYVQYVPQSAMPVDYLRGNSHRRLKFAKEPDFSNNEAGHSEITGVVAKFLQRVGAPAGPVGVGKSCELR